MVLGEKMGHGQAEPFRPWNPEQMLPLPPSPVDWLPENHLMFVLVDLAAELDLEAIHAVYRLNDPRDEKAYEPRMLVVLVLYAHCVGLPSSRKIEKACWEHCLPRVDWKSAARPQRRRGWWGPGIINGMSHERTRKSEKELEGELPPPSLTAATAHRAS